MPIPAPLGKGGNEDSGNEIVFYVNMQDSTNKISNFGSINQFCCIWLCFTLVVSRPGVKPSLNICPFMSCTRTRFETEAKCTLHGNAGIILMCFANQGIKLDEF